MVPCTYRGARLRVWTEPLVRDQRLAVSRQQSAVSSAPDACRRPPISARRPSRPRGREEGRREQIHAQETDHRHHYR
jgi:hypothetical protein